MVGHQSGGELAQAGAARLGLGELRRLDYEQVDRRGGGDIIARGQRQDLDPRRNHRCRMGRRCRLPAAAAGGCRASSKVEEEPGRAPHGAILLPTHWRLAAIQRPSIFSGFTTRSKTSSSTRPSSSPASLSVLPVLWACLAMAAAL